MAVALAIVRCVCRSFSIAVIAATSRSLPNQPFGPVSTTVRVVGSPRWEFPRNPKILLSLSGRSVRDTVIPMPASSVTV